MTAADEYQRGFQDGCRSTKPSEWVREQIAAAEREALERAAQAIEAQARVPLAPNPSPDLVMWSRIFASIVRDLMSKDTP